ncbi:MAG: DMT family transporter [Actinobacteria bacterium]|nr:DMT family transporter [Actinomycetota bacterium]
MTRRIQIIALLALTSVAAVWGASFVLMKDALKGQSVDDFLATRFIIATIALILFRPQALKEINLEMVMKGSLLGLFLGSGYLFQTIGLHLTTAATTGFITGLYVVFTPILGALFLKSSVTRNEWIGVVMATVGLALLSFKGFSIGLGELSVLLSALFFAFHILGLGRWSGRFATYPLTIVQLGTIAILNSLLALVDDGYEPPNTNQEWTATIFTALLATSLAFLVQTWSQSKMDATVVAVVLTLEVVFAALFAVIAGQESLTLRAILGGTLIFAAMILMQLRVESRETTQ